MPLANGFARILPGLFSFAGLFYLSVSMVSSARAVESVMPPQPDKPALVLLQNYQGDEPIEGWLMSEKLDGVRAYWNGKRLLSRQGKAFAVPDAFTQNFPPFELDGELWLGRGRFEETVSIVNRQQPHEGWQQLTYQIFEVPNQPGGLLQRLAVLERHLQVFPAPYLRIIQQTPVSGHEQVARRLSEVVAQGGEGLVLRDSAVSYYAGRAQQALKVKQKQDAECVVRDYTPGAGKYHGQVGALVCELLAGSFPALKAGQRMIKIGSGLSDQHRLTPLAKGTMVTFQYMGTNQNGLPRFPVFLRVRADKGL